MLTSDVGGPPCPVPSHHAWGAQSGPSWDVNHVPIRHDWLHYDHCFHLPAAPATTTASPPPLTRRAFADGERVEVHCEDDHDER